MEILEDIETQLTSNNITEMKVNELLEKLTLLTQNKHIYKNKLDDVYLKLNETLNRLSISSIKTIPDMFRHIPNKYQIDNLSKLLIRGEESRLYLSNYQTNLDNTKKNIQGTFTVLGSMRDNIREEYSIRLYKPNTNDKGMFWCSCPDHKFNSSKKKTVCKHICFIITKVFKILDPLFFQTKQLTQQQFNTILNNIEDKSKLLSDKSLCKTNNTTKPIFINIIREISNDDHCPICFEELTKDTIISCPTCLNYIHKECIKVWLERKNTCVFCRSDVFMHYKRVMSQQT